MDSTWEAVIFHPNALSVAIVPRANGTEHLSLSLKRLPLPRVKIFDGPADEVARSALAYCEGRDLALTGTGNACDRAERSGVGRENE